MGRKNPYTVAFVYPRVGEPFRIKGGYEDVKEWLEVSIDCSFLAHLTKYDKKLECTYRGYRRRKVRPVKGHKTSFFIQIVGDGCRADIYPSVYIKSSRRSRVKAKDKVKNGGYILQVIEKSAMTSYDMHLKRPPRCFPRELLPFCEDYKAEQFAKHGLTKTQC